jgi:uncharacterized protein
VESGRECCSKLGGRERRGRHPAARGDRRGPAPCPDARQPFEAGRHNIHSLSAYAIEEVKISPGRDRAVRVEIEMSNSAEIFQVDELLAEKLRGSGLEEHVEVLAWIDAEHEQRLPPVFRI